MADRVNLALIGLGYWGKNHLRTFATLREANLSYVCDLDPKNLEHAVQVSPNAKPISDPAQIWQDPAVQGVVIATPSPTHGELAKAALSAGKHVFVEKPLAMDIRQAEHLVSMAQKSGKHLMVGHLLKHHPVTHYLKQMIDSGELGEILYIYTQRLNLGVIRTDENPLWSLSTHDISLILHFLGEMPNRVSATGAKFLQKDIEDVVFGALHFPSGHMAHVHLSWLDPHKIRRLTIVGSQKMAVFDDMEPREKLRIYDKGAKKSGGAGTIMEYHMVREGDIYIPQIEAKEPLRLECLNFIRTILGQEASRSDGVEAVRILKVIMKLDESLHHAGKVIELN